MDYKLAKQESESDDEIVVLEDIEKMLKKDRESIFYFDRSNSDKSLNQLTKYFDKKDKSVYIREVRFGLDENDYIYEIHIL